MTRSEFFQTLHPLVPIQFWKSWITLPNNRTSILMPGRGQACVELRMVRRKRDSQFLFSFACSQVIEVFTDWQPWGCIVWWCQIDWIHAQGTKMSFPVFVGTNWWIHLLHSSNLRSNLTLNDIEAKFRTIGDRSELKKGKKGHERNSSLGRALQIQKFEFLLYGRALLEGSNAMFNPKCTATSQGLANTNKDAQGLLQPFRIM